MNILKEIKWKINYWIINPIQRFFTGCGNIDTWDAYLMIAKKTLPILKKYKKSKKMGIPSFIGTEYKKELIAMGYMYDVKSYCYRGTVNGKEAWEAESDIWESILDEWIFAFEFVITDDVEDCYIENTEYNENQKEAFNFIPNKDGLTYTLHTNKDYGKTKLDWDLYKKKTDRVEKALESYGKNWRSLWD